MIKKIILSTIMLFAFSQVSVAGDILPIIIKDKPQLNTLVTVIALGAEINESTSRLGEGICRGLGGSNCTGAGLGEGICRAGGGSNCTGASLGEGICRAGGGFNCTGVSVAEGVCRAGGGSNCSGL